ncbi:MAG: hypothetical protein GXO87_05920 [Chlorobi bacterium]|nr:hypothetical protein [Chlorobiota bacterium]
MKRIKLLIIFLSIVNATVFAQASGSISPAVYYTYGSYDNSNTSQGIAGYASLQLGINDLIVAAYENLKIKSEFWEYKQNFGALGYFKTLFPFYFNLSLAYVDGRLNVPLFDYGYKDEIFLGNFDFSYNYDFYFFGAGATVQKLKGLYNINTRFYYLKLSWTPETNFSLTFKPGYTKTNDGREYYSLGAKIYYSPFYFLNFTAVGFAGKRVFYFDPDFLTNFNQYETQKNSFGVFIKIIPYKYLTVITGYNYADFTDYKINYYTLGLKYYFGF